AVVDVLLACDRAEADSEGVDLPTQGIVREQQPDLVHRAGVDPGLYEPAAVVVLELPIEARGRAGLAREQVAGRIVRPLFARSLRVLVEEGVVARQIVGPRTRVTAHARAVAGLVEFVLDRAIGRRAAADVALDHAAQRIVRHHPQTGRSARAE